MSVDQMIIGDLIKTSRQRDVAQEYACLLEDAEFGYDVPWREINEAIMARWPKGLMRVKEMAWKFYERGEP